MRRNRGLRSDSVGDTTMSLMDILGNGLGAVLFLLILVTIVVYLLPKIVVNLNLLPLEVLPSTDSTVDLPSAAVGQPYRALFATRGGNEPVELRVDAEGRDALLPDGLRWIWETVAGCTNPVLCGIQGTPTGPVATNRFRLEAVSAKVADDPDGSKWAGIPSRGRRSEPKTFRLAIVPATVVNGLEVQDLEIVSPAELPPACLNDGGEAVILLAAKGGVWPYAWSVSNACVKGPDGRTQGIRAAIAADGVLTCRVPSLPAELSFGVTVTSAKAEVMARCGRRAAASRSFACRVLPVGGQPLRLVLPPFLPNARVGEPYGAQIAAEGGTPPYSWTLDGGVPPSLRPQTQRGPSLTLAGTPIEQEAGRYEMRIGVQDSFQRCATAATLAVQPAQRPLRVATTNLPAAVAGRWYDAALKTEGGIETPRWDVASGTLPAGIRLNRERGTFEGTPTSVSQGPVKVTVEAAQSDGTRAQATLVLVVLAAILPEPLAILTGSNLPPGQVGSAYELQLAAEGGVPPYAWRPHGDWPRAGRIPLTLSKRGGLRAPPFAHADVYEVAAEVTDAFGTTASRAFALPVRPPPDPRRPPKLRLMTPAALPAAVVEREYVVALSAEGGWLPYRWVAGGLPPWLSHTGGTLRGTPPRTALGPQTVTVSLTDGQSPADQCTASLSLEVLPGKAVEAWWKYFAFAGLATAYLILLYWLRVRREAGLVAENQRLHRELAALASRGLVVVIEHDGLSLVPGKPVGSEVPISSDVFAELRTAYRDARARNDEAEQRIKKRFTAWAAALSVGALLAGAVLACAVLAP